MLVANPRDDGRRQYCDGGSGIFDAISRKVLPTGFKKAIRTDSRLETLW